MEELSFIEISVYHRSLNACFLFPGIFVQSAPICQQGEESDES